VEQGAALEAASGGARARGVGWSGVIDERAGTQGVGGWHRQRAGWCSGCREGGIDGRRASARGVDGGGGGGPGGDVGRSRYSGQSWGDARNASGRVPCKFSSRFIPNIEGIFSFLESVRS
jgi:hypothetical protein